MPDSVALESFLQRRQSSERITGDPEVILSLHTEQLPKKREMGSP
jgi:hypothetical protein